MLQIEKLGLLEMNKVFWLMSKYCRKVFIQNF